MTKTEQRIDRQRERLQDEIAATPIGETVDLVNWIYGYHGAGSKARVQEAVTNGLIGHERECFYRVLKAV